MRVQNTADFFRLAFLTIWVNRNCEPEKGLITHVLQISKSDCITEGDRTAKCVSAKYVRASAFCSLYTVVFDDLQNPGITIYTKTFSENVPTPGQCYDNCDISVSCGPPTQIPGTTILDNMVDVGSRVKHVCKDGSGARVSECLLNGSWSLVSLRCERTCILPSLLYGMKMKNVLNWKYVDVDEQTVSAVAECPASCATQYQRPAICNKETGHWSLMSDICCNLITPNINCPRGTQGNRRCYFLSNEERGWKDAKKDCMERNGHLAEVHSLEDSNSLDETISASGHQGSVWIGGTDENLDKWKWATSGKDFTFNKWYSNQPDNYLGVEHCVEVNYWNVWIGWNDNNCEREFRYMCEYWYYE